MLSFTASHPLMGTLKGGIQLLQNVRSRFLECIAQLGKGLLGLRSDRLEVLHELSGRARSGPRCSGGHLGTGWRLGSR